MENFSESFQWRINCEVWKFQAKMKEAKTEYERNYFCGFIGGMKYLKQIAGEKTND
jgi:hypothetical protein